MEVLAAGGLAGEVGDLDRVGRDEHDLVLAQLDGLAGVFDEGGDIAGEVVLALAPADDQRRVPPGPDDGPGDGGVHGEQGESPLQPLAHHPHAGGEQLRAVGWPAARRSASAAESRCAAHSVSVSLVKLTPSASSSARSFAKFSMMPL